MGRHSKRRQGTPDGTLGLTARQRMFVAEYLRDLNGRQAAIRAGYPPKAAHVQASQLLSNPSVAQAVRVMLEKREAKTAMSAAEVEARLTRIARASIGDYATWDEHGVRLVPSAALTRGAKTAVGEVSETGDGQVRFKLRDSVAALEKIGQLRGLFPLGRGGAASLYLAAGARAGIVAEDDGVVIYLPDNGRPVALDGGDPVLSNPSAGDNGGRPLRKRGKEV